MSSPNGHGSPGGTPSDKPRSDLPSISLIIGIASIPGALLSIVGGMIAGGAAVIIGRRALAQREHDAVVEKGVAIAGILTGGAGLLLAVVTGAFFLAGGF